MTNDVRAYIEVGPGTKVRLRQAIEALIDVLDSWDADPDVEDGGDLEEQHDLEDDPAESGIADMDGAYEQLPFLNGAGWVE